MCYLVIMLVQSLPEYSPDEAYKHDRGKGGVFTKDPGNRHTVPSRKLP